MKSKWNSIVLILLFGSVIVIVVMGFAIKQNASANPRSTKDWLSKEARSLEQELQNSQLSDNDRASIEAKLSALYYQATLQAEGIRQLTEMPTQAEAALQTMANPTLIVTENRLTGIIENPSVPFSPLDFVIDNAWQERVNGNYVIVYAGSLRSDPSQGILIVFNDASREFRFFTTPNKNGSVRIVNAENLRLIVQQENTTEKLYFDVLTLSFVSALDKVIRTIVPTEMQGISTQTPAESYPSP